VQTNNLTEEMTQHERQTGKHVGGVYARFKIGILVHTDKFLRHDRLSRLSGGTPNVPGSKLGPKTGYRGRSCNWFSSVSSGNYQDSTSKGAMTVSVNIHIR
jgi:hypothetical protein